MNIAAALRQKPLPPPPFLLTCPISSFLLSPPSFCILHFLCTVVITRCTSAHAVGTSVILGNAARMATLGGIVFRLCPVEQLFKAAPLNRSRLHWGLNNDSSESLPKKSVSIHTPLRWSCSSVLVEGSCQICQKQYWKCLLITGFTHCALEHPLLISQQTGHILFIECFSAVSNVQWLLFAKICTLYMVALDVFSVCGMFVLLAIGTEKM